MLRISDNGRFLEQADGTPFFYLGDTAWAIFQRLSREEIDHYLADRAVKQFTVIQGVAVSEFDGLSAPNVYGELPFFDANPARPNDAYFRHVDYVIEKASTLGLYIGLLPTWGDKVGPVLWGRGPEVFNVENAEAYGRYLGERYQDAPIIWILGGDRNPDSPARKAIWYAMADGIRSGGAKQLMTYHPVGVSSTGLLFPGEEWLDFNMMQSCHFVLDRDNYNFIAYDYGLKPPKPCMDSEPNYEEMPIGLFSGTRFFDAYDARKAAYWAVFAGAHGHTYGANGVFQFWDGSRKDVFQPRRPWSEALQLPGAAQMQYLRRLIESRPMLKRIPDQRLLASDSMLGTNHIQATHADDGSYAFIYSAAGQSFKVDMSKLSGQSVVAHWFDPRTGETQAAGNYANEGALEFVPPSSGPENDWVLILDDTSHNYPRL